MTLDTIKNTTSITTALAITLCGASFWMGGELQNIRVRLVTVASAQIHNEKETEEWRSKTTQILSELKELGRDNKVRLDYLAKENK